MADRLIGDLKVLDTQVDEIEFQIKAWRLNSEVSKRLEKVRGVWPAHCDSARGNGRRREELLQPSSGGCVVGLHLHRRLDQGLRPE